MSNVRTFTVPNNPSSNTYYIAPLMQAPQQPPAKARKVMEYRPQRGCECDEMYHQHSHVVHSDPYVTHHQHQLVHDPSSCEGCKAEREAAMKKSECECCDPMELLRHAFSFFIVQPWLFLQRCLVGACREAREGCMTYRKADDDCHQHCHHAGRLYRVY